MTTKNKFSPLLFERNLIIKYEVDTTQQTKGNESSTQAGNYCLVAVTVQPSLRAARKVRVPLSDEAEVSTSDEQVLATEKVTEGATL